MDILVVIKGFIGDSGFAQLGGRWKNLGMIGISCVLIYLAVGKKFEPLLLLPLPLGCYWPICRWRF